MAVEWSKVSALQHENATKTLPYELYVDFTVLQREYECIFKKTWQYVGHIGQFQNNKATVRLQIGRFPEMEKASTSKWH